jgi:8-oxo-dGTP diphosphatase
MECASIVKFYDAGTPAELFLFPLTNRLYHLSFTARFNPERHHGKGLTGPPMSRKTSCACPSCGASIPAYRNPVPTVDIIIEVPDGGIVLIRRRHAPAGWAIPGGYVDYGESLEEAAVRESKEETSLDVTLIKQMHTYSRPDRDPRQHTVTTVFIAKADGRPQACDDAAGIGIFHRNNLPEPLAFDHEQILRDYFQSKVTP